MKTVPRTAPRIETDPDVLRSFLSDAAHVPGGFAQGVAFPRTAEEVSALLATVPAVLPVGGGAGRAQKRRVAPAP